MMSQDLGHEHPLVFIKELSNQSEDSPHQCSRCGEVTSGPSFSCADCGFYLHKECAEAPSQINHPFHRNHPLCLLPNPPSKYSSRTFFCDFCGERGERFDYNCSYCDLDFHIKCALFTYNLAEKNKVGELTLIAWKDPSISTENDKEEVGSAKCFGCWEPLFDSIYHSLDCGFNLHKKCAELPFQINYPCHHKHPLILQFSGEIFSCVICQETTRSGFFYVCSLCNFVIHIACMSPPSIIEDKGHQHPFTLFFRQVSFTCDVCGIQGNCVPYMCSNCNLLVHKKCISLPRIIKFAWHEHPIFHTYFLQRHESENWDCVVCRDEVNTEHGSYYCSDCHFIVHVNCGLKIEDWYYIVEPDEKLGDNSTLLSDISMDSFTVIERNEDGETTMIKHFSHVHNLMLSDDKIGKDDKYCDGCTLYISDSFYYCSLCNFFLHRLCAEFRKKKYFWLHICQKPLVLISDYLFKCSDCDYVRNGFAYNCDDCSVLVCLQCATPYTLTCQGHKHPLFFYVEHKGQCNACGDEIDGVYKAGAYKCKECNFALDWDCVRLPSKARHKCDQHLLTLTYHDDNTYSAYHFCDICEEDRNPKHWFYYCAICDTCAHIKCVLGRYPFMKMGKVYKEGNHPHPLTFVKKMYYYPKCFVCDEPCEDLALECRESGCEYIVHWDCIAPSDLQE